MSDVEIWKPAPSLEGQYEVSSFGRVRNAVRGNIRRLKYCKRNYAWLTVSNGRGSSRNISVARLVCEAFHGPPPPHAEADHGNGFRSDNGPENVSWKTKAENLAQRVHCAGSRHPVSKLTADLVRLIRETPRSEVTDQAFATLYGVSRRHLSAVRTGEYWNA